MDNYFTRDDALLCERDRLQNIEPLVVRPAIARRLLGGLSTEKLWDLINGGDLESFMDGRARRITMASIRSFIDRGLQAAARERAARTQT